MAKINRNSIEDSKRIVEQFLVNELVRKETLMFLADGINCANQLNPNNWNLNLDKNGQFIRFNIGQVICIEIFKDKVNVLCLKENLKKNVSIRELKIQYVGYLGKEKVLSDNIDGVPDFLSKVPDSIACYIGHDKLIEYLPILKEANQQFIWYSVKNTTQHTLMRSTHSPGFLAYLNQNGFFNKLEIISENQYVELHRDKQITAKKIDYRTLKQRAENALKNPEKKIVKVTKFIRDQNVVEYAKRRANGVCQDCKQPAPFISKSTREPFLETHHVIPLADGGEDTIENTIAICPNCHRKRHHG